MMTLHDKESGAVLGTVSDDDFQLLFDLLELESRTDSDYYIESGTIELIEAEQGSPALIDVLRKGLGGRSGFDVTWSEGGAG